MHDAFRQRRKMVFGYLRTQGNFAHMQYFNIGNDCRTQLLILQAAGGSNQLGPEFALRSADVTPE